MVDRKIDRGGCPRDLGDYHLAPNTHYDLRVYVYDRVMGAPNAYSDPSHAVVLDDFSLSFKTDPTSYSTSFNEGGSPVSIAVPDFANAAVLGGIPYDGISDGSSLNLTKAEIYLTNAKAGDVLSATALPAGISATIDPLDANHITLSGTATLAAYEAAIAGVKFSNSSQNPDTTLRDITVQVWDDTCLLYTSRGV